MDGEWDRSLERNSHGNLTARGRPAHTFGGLLLFTAAVFLGCGIYLIAEPMIHPMSAHEAGVIVGGFALALAAILLFYLLKPGPRHSGASAAPRAEAAKVREEGQPRAGLALEPVRVRRTRAR